ncbi:uncharacterized protein [Periplaneta americana]|uniref:uncharacterized protein isoform X2 n=1 Tax=Periplaneta americana TaxID=6978 RepID=UPI0037E961A8
MKSGVGAGNDETEETQIHNESDVSTVYHGDDNLDETAEVGHQYSQSLLSPAAEEYANVQATTSNVNTAAVPTRSLSSPSSSSSGSGVSSGSGSRAGPSTKRRKIHPGQGAYAVALESIADSLSQPVTVTAQSAPACPVDACMALLGSMLKEFRSEQLKLDVMNSLVQAVINAKSIDLEK